MKTWWLLLMTRSRRDSATTGLGNNGYQSCGALLEVKISEAPARSVISSYRSSAWAGVSSRIAKSSRISTAGRASSPSRLCQVLSAWPPARWARARLVLRNRTSAPWRMARCPRAWATWLLPTPTGPYKITDSAVRSHRRAARSRICAAGSLGEALKSKPSRVACSSNRALRSLRVIEVAWRREISSSHRTWRNSMWPSSPARAWARRASMVSSMPDSFSVRRALSSAPVSMMVVVMVSTFVSLWRLMSVALLGGLAGHAEPAGDLRPGAPAGPGPCDGGGQVAVGLAGGQGGLGDPVQDIDGGAGRQRHRGGALAEGGARRRAGAAQRDPAQGDLGGQGAVRPAGRVARVVAQDRARAAGEAGHDAASAPGRSGTTFPAAAGSAANSASGPCRNAPAPPSPAGAVRGACSVPAARMPLTVR